MAQVPSLPGRSLSPSDKVELKNVARFVGVTHANINALYHFGRAAWDLEVMQDSSGYLGLRI